jgi:hypothetical protein
MALSTPRVHGSRFVLAMANVLLAFALVGCTKSPTTDSSTPTTDSSTGAAPSATPVSSTPTTPDECPKDLLAARGAACRPDGKTCGTDAPGFTHFIMCSRGRWTEMNAPPPPPPPATRQ